MEEKVFKFKVSRKVKVWITDYVNVYAETKEDALNGLNEVKDEAMKEGWPSSFCDLENSETDYETVELVSIEENGGAGS